MQERDKILRLNLRPFRRESEGGFNDVEDGYDLSRGLRHNGPGVAFVSRRKRGRWFGETEYCVLKVSGETHEAQGLQTIADQSLFLAGLSLEGLDR